jgi:polyisoprenoid-binding protein YceI
MTGIAPSITPATYPIDAGHSGVSFTVRALFGLATVHGTMPVVDGTVVVADEPAACAVTATVDATGFATGNRRRDTDVRSARFLDTAAHPVWSFRGTGFDGSTLTGVLTVRGVDAEVAFAVSSAPSPGGCRFQATGRVDRTAFGVTSGRGMVGRHVEVRITLAVTTGATYAGPG